MTQTKWKPIEEAERGIGQLLLRAGPGLLDGVFIGHQDPVTGRWFDQENREVRPLYWASLPSFDLDGALQ